MENNISYYNINKYRNNNKIEEPKRKYVWDIDENIKIEEIDKSGSSYTTFEGMREDIENTVENLNNYFVNYTDVDVEKIRKYNEEYNWYDMSINSVEVEYPFSRPIHYKRSDCQKAHDIIYKEKINE